MIPGSIDRLDSVIIDPLTNKYNWIVGDNTDFLVINKIYNILWCCVNFCDLFFQSIQRVKTTNKFTATAPYAQQCQWNRFKAPLFLLNHLKTWTTTVLELEHWSLQRGLKPLRNKSQQAYIFLINLSWNWYLVKCSFFFDRHDWLQIDDLPNVCSLSIGLIQL